MAEYLSNSKIFGKYVLVKVQTIKSSPLILLSLKDKQIEDKKDIEIPAENNEDNSVEKVVKQKRTKKNFQCKECNKSFRDNYKLKRHEKVHMKMKLPEKTLDGQNLGEAYDSYLKGNLLRGIVNFFGVQIDLLDGPKI